MQLQIVFETHCLTTDNETGIATGWLHGTLSAAGRELARQLGERRRSDSLAAIYVSDLARAVQTAAIAFPAGDIPLIQDPRLRECDYGDWNGMPVQKLVAERRNHIDVPFPGGQSYREVVARMQDFLGEMRSGHDGERVLLISHSANRWALDHLLLGIPLEDLVDAPFNWQEGWEYTVV